MNCLLTGRGWGLIPPHPCQEDLRHQQNSCSPHWWPNLGLENLVGKYLVEILFVTTRGRSRHIQKLLSPVESWALGEIFSEFYTQPDVCSH